ncbi:MAG: PilZ domain-containing protein, partial [Candidatus Adiutrix sp.]|nr:PilZ domain-containing protein [Candidatus Adiutrix sp.]
IKEILDNYKLRPDDPLTMTALALGCPSVGGLTETNARMDFRLNITDDRKISIQTHPSFGRVSLLDFSAGGVLIAIPRPPQAKVGMRLWFTLFFPVLTAAGQPITINGEAEVMRVSMDEGEQMARVGLKFLDLDLSATRALQKAINYYMLEEQRGRGRPGGVQGPGGGQVPGGGQAPGGQTPGGQMPN